MEISVRQHPHDPGEGQVPARDPFIRQVAAVVAIVVAAGLLLTVVVIGIDILLAAFAGVLFAVLLRAFTDLLRRYTGLPDGWAYTLVLLGLLAVLVIAGLFLAPQITDQVDQLREEAPQMIGEFEEFLEQRTWGQWILERTRDGGGQGEGGNGVVEAVGPALSGLLSTFTILITIFFVGLFAAASPRMYQDGIVHLAPLRHRPVVRELVGEIGYTLRWWLIGRAIAMTMVGVTTAVVLMLLGIPFALLLGVLAGLFTFVPYLGPIVAGVPIVLFALLEGPQQALWVLLAYTVIQQVEGNVLDPIIMHKLIYIPPVLTIVMQVLMGVVLGIMGIVMATPLAAVLIVLNRFYRREILGDPLAGEDDDSEEGEEEGKEADDGREGEEEDESEG
jgi:predicted PurR-regulated permease PerM